MFWPFAFIVSKSFMGYTSGFILIYFVDISQFYLLYGCYLFGIMHGQILHPSWDSPYNTLFTYFLWSLRVHISGLHFKHWQIALHNVVPSTSPHERRSNSHPWVTDRTSTSIITTRMFRGHHLVGVIKMILNMDKNKVIF